MINFPDNPSNNQVFTSGNQTWVYDGTKWLAMGVAGGIYLPLSGGILTGALTPAGGIVGVVDGSSAAPGMVGEVISGVITTTVPLTSTVVANVLSISLTAGDWDVSGEVWFANSAAATFLSGAIVSASNGMQGTSYLQQSTHRLYISFPGAGVPVFSLHPARVNLTATAPYYLTARADFASGTVVAGGNIIARRMR